MNILITGGTGFVGRALVNQLGFRGHSITALVRNSCVGFPTSVKQVIFPELGKLSSLDRASVNTDFDCFDGCDNYKALKDALNETDVIVHAAARVHVMKESTSKPLNAFRAINTKPTLTLARLAAASGVKRFIFFSSIKVNGESTTDGAPFSENDACQPSDPYAISKYEAEKGLIEIAKNTDMEVVIVRPPLIYGPSVKGNFSTMMSWVGKGFPLPLGVIKNQRSLLALDNLIDFISICLTHPKAAGQTFLISDGEDISTSELLQKLADVQGKNARLINVPTSIIKIIAKLLGKSAVIDRLFGSLQVNTAKAQELLGWKAQVTIDEQMKKMKEDIN